MLGLMKLCYIIGIIAYFPLRAFATTSVAESKPTASMVLYGKKAVMLAGFTQN